MRYSFAALACALAVAGLIAWAVLTGIAEALNELPHQRPAPPAQRCKCPAGACKCCGCCKGH